MFLFPRRRQGPKNGTSVLTSNAKAFWPFGDAHDAAVLADSTGRGNDLEPYIRISPTTCAFRIGRNASYGAYSGQQVYGSMKGWGRWERILTSGEKAALYGKEYWPFSTTTSLQDVKAYYLLDEAGGSSAYADATGRGNTLTASGTTTQVTGPAGGADKATNLTTLVYLEEATPGADLQSDQATVTVAGWVLLDSKPAGGFMQQCFWCQLVNNTPDSGFNVYFDPTSDRFTLDNDAGDGMSLNRGSLVLSNNFGSPALSTWYFLIAEFDVQNNRITISVNNGTPDALPHTLQPIQAAINGHTGSLFEANVEASFPLQRSGWDGSPGTIVGNSYASMAPNADVSIGDNAKTVWGWFQASDTTTVQVLVGIDGNYGAATDWAIRLESNTLVFMFGATRTTVSVAFTDTASPHLVVAWFDKATGKIHIDLDNSASSANASGASPHTVSQELRVGSNGYGGYQFRGILWGWGVADGTPSVDDLAYLWNDGSGITLP